MADLYSLPYLIYSKVGTTAIRVSRVSQFCTSNLNYFYIKAELDVHLAIMVRKWIVQAVEGMPKSQSY